MENDGAARGGAAEGASAHRRGNRHGGNRGGRGGNRSGGDGRRPSTIRFEGREPSLKGFIFDVNKHRNDNDRFVRTAKEIESYVGRTYSKYTAELTRAVAELELVMPAPVATPQAGATAIEIEIWKTDRKEWQQRTQAYNDFKAGLCSVVLGQCTEALDSNVRSSGDYNAAQADGIAMLIIVRNIMNNFEDHRNMADAICEMDELFYTMKKGRYESLQGYYDRFKAHVGVMNRVGSDLVRSGIVEVIAGDPDNPTEAENAAAVERLKAVRFIRGAGDSYKNYLVELKHAMLEGRDNYPTTLDAAFNILQRRQSENAPPMVQDGVAFVTAGDNGRTYAHIRCNRCNLLGHYGNHCPTGDADDKDDDAKTKGEGTE